MQIEIAGIASDAHPHLQVPFCESVCRLLLDTVRWSDAEGSTAKIRSHVSYILSRVLPLCSTELLTTQLCSALVHYLELATTSEAR